MPGEEAEPAPEPDALALAAECLGRGDRANAAVHLETYVCRHPDQLMFRAQLAELLVRVGRDDAARVHLERFIADAQCATGAPRNYLVNAHTRLMEIAQRTDDHFAEVFHRGVGLLLLAKEQDKLADADLEFGEEMLCKSIKALGEAKELKPTDPRVRVYLAEAYDRSGNRRAAESERVAARSGFVPGQLEPDRAEAACCLRRTLPLLRRNDLRHIEAARSEIGVERFDAAAARLEPSEGFPHLVPPQERERVWVRFRDLAKGLELRAEVGGIGRRLPQLGIAILAGLLREPVLQRLGLPFALIRFLSRL